MKRKTQNVINGLIVFTLSIVTTGAIISIINMGAKSNINIEKEYDKRERVEFCSNLYDDKTIEYYKCKEYPLNMKQSEIFKKLEPNKENENG